MPIFVVQRHDARRLHYDLRLERRRSARELGGAEGHPRPAGRAAPCGARGGSPARVRHLRRRDTEGEYGAGTVEIWDRGTYELLEEKRNGGLTVALHGKRLDGVDARAGEARRRSRRTGSCCARTPALPPASSTRRCSPRRRTRRRGGPIGCSSRSGTAFARCSRCVAVRGAHEPQRKRPHRPLPRGGAGCGARCGTTVGRPRRGGVRARRRGRVEVRASAARGGPHRARAVRRARDRRRADHRSPARGARASGWSRRLTCAPAASCCRRSSTTGKRSSPRRGSSIWKALSPSGAGSRYQPGRGARTGAR